MALPVFRGVGWPRVNLTPSVTCNCGRNPASPAPWAKCLLRNELRRRPDCNPPKPRMSHHNFILYEWVETNAAWELNIVQRPKDAVGWVLLPIRWTVERTFAWLGRCRRLSKDREKSVRSSEAFVKLAMIHLMLNRLAQKKRMPSSTIVRRHKPTCGTDTYSTPTVIGRSTCKKDGQKRPRPARGVSECLSCMNGDIHVQFLGEGVAATSPPYPTVITPARKKPIVGQAGKPDSEPCQAGKPDLVRL